MAIKSEFYTILITILHRYIKQCAHFLDKTTTSLINQHVLMSF